MTRDTATGELYLYPPKVYSTQADAYADMRREYLEDLKDMGLEDNGQCDDDGDACEGGCFTEDAASIICCCDYAMGQLLEVELFTIHELR